MPADISVQIAGIKGLRNRLKGLGASKTITEALRKRLVRAWAGGADTFIRVALKKVAVDTGMSAATFYALAQALKDNQEIGRVKALQAVEAKIAAPPRGQQKGVPTFPAGRRRQGIQDVQEGKELGKTAYVFSFPTPSSKQFVFKFSFQTVSWQMAFHDPGIEALLGGIEAFEARVAREFEQEARFVLREFFKGKTLSSQGILS